MRGLISTMAVVAVLIPLAAVLTPAEADGDGATHRRVAHHRIAHRHVWRCSAGERWQPWPQFRTRRIELFGVPGNYTDRPDRCWRSRYPYPPA